MEPSTASVFIYLLLLLLLSGHMDVELGKEKTIRLLHRIRLDHQKEWNTVCSISPSLSVPIYTLKYD